MGILSDIKGQMAALRPGRKDLRNLGLLFGAAAALAAGVLYWQEKGAWPWLLGLGLLMALWGLAWPRGLRPLHKIWMGLAFTLGYIVSRLLLTALFYLVLSPIGLVLRIMGRDLLDIKHGGRESYWQERPEEKYDPRTTEKMY